MSSIVMPKPPLAFWIFFIKNGFFTSKSLNSRKPLIKKNKVLILKEYKTGLENDKYISCKINPVLENLSYFNISFKLFIEEIKNIFICYEELER